MPNELRILIVEDDAILRKVVASLFTRFATVYELESGHDAINFLKTHSVDLVFSDVCMPNGTGIELLDWARTTLKAPPPIVLVTGQTEITARQAAAKGAYFLVEKPFKVKDLQVIVQKIKAELDSGSRQRAG